MGRAAIARGADSLHAQPPYPQAMAGVSRSYGNGTGARPASRRAWLSAALVAFALAAGYGATASLARVTPALFPGQDLPLPGVGGAGFNVSIPVARPGPESVFNEPITVLIVGIDRRVGDWEASSTDGDSVMVASLDPVARRAAMLSLPRDLLVTTYPSEGSPYQGRLAQSFSAGYANGRSLEEGASRVQRDLERNFGVDIDYWLVIDFEGVRRIVDSVGGIDVDIPPDLAVPEWRYSDDDQNPRTLSFAPGHHHLDGYQALAFGRYRATDDDFHRIRRQQLVIQAIVPKMFTLSLNRNPFDLWDAYSGMVTTNIPRGRAPGYALLARQAGGVVTMYSAGDPVAGIPTVADYTTPGGAAVLTWRPDNMRYWFEVTVGRPQTDGSAAQAPLPGSP
jgi:LCP family protein required for cell wall assembly